MLFLLVINSNLATISHCLRNTATYSLKLFIKNCGQTAADRNMINVDSPQEVRSCQRAILRYHRRPPTNYRLATIHPLQKMTKGQTIIAPLRQRRLQHSFSASKMGLKPVWEYFRAKIKTLNKIISVRNLVFVGILLQLFVGELQLPVQLLFDPPRRCYKVQTRLIRFSINWLQAMQLNRCRPTTSCTCCSCTTCSRFLPPPKRLCFCRTLICLFVCVWAR